MSKICIPNYKRNDVGGGGTWCRNFAKGSKIFGHQIVEVGEEYDILLIAGASLCDREVVDMARDRGKPIILRVDNILEDSKNRNTGMTKMREYAGKADVIIYQSEWAKNLLMPICGNGTVIYNGVDTDIFYPRESVKPNDTIRVFYSRWGRGEGKNFHSVQYFWREYNLEKKEDTLVIVGKFGDESLKIANPFEFHNGEDYEYHGIVTDQEKLANIMRSCDVALLPYMFDACSNTILEAQACGLPVIYHESGGTPDLITMGVSIDFSKSPVDLVKLARGTIKRFHKDDHKEMWGIEEMCRRYDAIFKLLKSGQYEL
jgi:glycosyltransferase involved in cell wall biosynthesis